MYKFYKKLSAEVCDLDKSIGHSFGDIEFYAERLQGCTGVILEAAVGTGRMLMPLLQKGFIVNGLDISADMLDICQRNCLMQGFHPTIHQGAMETFNLPVPITASFYPSAHFYYYMSGSVRSAH